jgi:hypothetical protein
MADRNSLDAFVAGRGSTLLALFIGLLGTVAIAVAILWLADAPVFHADAQRAEATVTKLKRVKLPFEDAGGMKSGPLKKFDDVPVVCFQDGPRQVEVPVANTNHPVGKFLVGQKVTVVYRSGKPEQARIPSFYEFYSGPLFFGGVGVFFDLIALAMFTAIRRKRNAASIGIGLEPTGDAELD